MVLYLVELWGNCLQEANVNYHTAAWWTKSWLRGMVSPITQGYTNAGQHCNYILTEGRAVRGPGNHPSHNAQGGICWMPGTTMCYPSYFRIVSHPTIAFTSVLELPRPMSQRAMSQSQVHCAKNKTCAPVPMLQCRPSRVLLHQRNSQFNKLFPAPTVTQSLREKWYCLLPK